MAKKNFYVDIDVNEQEIQNVSLEKLAVDPTGTGLYDGRIWNNTTDNRIKWYDGTAIRVLSHEATTAYDSYALGNAAVAVGEAYYLTVNNLEGIPSDGVSHPVVIRRV